MGRKRKGRPLDGWLIIDKPLGWTSTSVVNKVRWAFGAAKAGHAGTLDPAATGVLAVAFGEATKTIPYVTDDLKCYEFTVALGAATNTDDAEGKVIATSASRPSQAEVEAALPGFVGDIMQVPPQFSAVKINGERAYARAREGEDVEIAARPLWVESLSLTAMPDADTITLEMVCGKGGYVRSVARDLGKTLGCLGHVTALRRTWSGPFEVQDAIDFTEIENSGPANEALDQYLLPLEAGLASLDEQPVKPEAAARLRSGNPCDVAYTALEFGQECWASLDGKAVAIGTYQAGKFAPSRVFVTQKP